MSDWTYFGTAVKRSVLLFDVITEEMGSLRFGNKRKKLSIAHLDDYVSSTTDNNRGDPGIYVALLAENIFELEFLPKPLVSCYTSKTFRPQTTPPPPAIPIPPFLVQTPNHPTKKLCFHSWLDCLLKNGPHKVETATMTSSEKLLITVKRWNILMNICNFRTPC